LEGNCNGVYVDNKTKTGFDVIELQNGQSNVKFSWSVVANRADQIDEQGNVVSKHVGVRFPDGPGPLESMELETTTKENKKSEIKEVKKSELEQFKIK
jgi:phosphosulfolactate synthase (CoM biosynthesis protein A)